MSRRLRRRSSSSKSKGKDKVIASPAYPETTDVCFPPCLLLEDVDCIGLPDDTVIKLFSCLNYRDRASLASTCRSWRLLTASPCFWTALDLRAHHCDPDTVASLAPRCTGLVRLRFRGHESVAAALYLEARRLREISGDNCRAIGDATLSVLVARHEALETLQIGPDPCEKISSDAIRHVAMCCPWLRRLRLSGVRYVDGDTVAALARHCLRLEEVAFTDCGIIDGATLERISSVRFLSIVGSRNVIAWSSVSLAWTKLPNLVSVDVSRTDVSSSDILRLISSAKSLKVICALNCVSLEDEWRHTPMVFSNTKGKLLFALFIDMFKGITSLFTVCRSRLLACARVLS